MRSTRELKYMAKAAMRGKTGWLILVMLTEVLLNFAVGTLTDTFFGGPSMLDLIIGQVFSFILSLVFCVVSALPSSKNSASVPAVAAGKLALFLD